MPRVRKSAKAFMSDVWKIALYIRLSKEDWKENAKIDNRRGAKNELTHDAADISRSIVEQKKMLEEYVETHFQDDFIIIDVYVDDGLTGTDDITLKH